MNSFREIGGAGILSAVKAVTLARRVRALRTCLMICHKLLQADVKVP
jgi:hypothetical protein